MACDVLITYSWNRVGYCILRDLTDHGLSVITADTSKYNTCSMSNRVNKSFVYADPFVHTQQFIRDVCRIIEENQPKVLLPTHEETFIIAKYREHLPADIIIPIMDFASLLKANHKITAAGIAEQLAVPVPRIYQPQSLEELKSMESSLKYPVVLKMPKSNAAKNVYYAHDFAELLKLFSKYYHPQQKREDFIYLQDFVQGVGYGASFLYNRGQMVTGFVHKRLTEKTHTGGVSTKRASVKNETMLDYGRRILDSLSWHGAAMVEFKYDEQTDKAWFIEINPRYWGSLPLPVAAGLPIPYWHYCIAVNQPFEVNDYRSGIISKWILGEMIALVDRILSRKLTWRELCEFFNFKADNYDDFKKDDPKAFIGEILYYFLKLVKSGQLNPESHQSEEY